MAGKNTISITFKLDGDNNSFKQLAGDANGFKGVIEATISESEHLKKSLVNWSQGAQAIGAITDTIRNVSDAFSKMSEKMKSTQADNVLTAQLTGKTGDEMLKLRNSVKATADQFGEDFGETMQAVNALAKGFGISIDDAMQLMRDGFVSGANANGEFIDTLKEYPRYFSEAGLSAEEFIAITTNAAKQGIYSDKGVDVIKEGNLRIREMTKATAEALDAIGISSEKVQENLRNGSITTFDVMQMVASKLGELPASSAAVGTAIADIFGGPGEDAGLEYIKSLSTVQLSMSALKDAAGEVAVQQEKQISMQEGLKNSLSGLIDLSAIYTNVQPYVDMTAQVGMAMMGVGSLVKTLQSLNIQQAITATKTLAVAAAHKAAAAASAVWTAAQKALNFVLSANPIAIVIRAIAALVAALVLAYKHCDGFREICDKVWAVIKPLANAIMNGLAKAFEWLADKCRQAWDWLKKILGLGGKKVEVEVNVTKTTTEKAPALDLGDYAVKPSAPAAPKSSKGSSKSSSGSSAADTGGSSGIIGQLEAKIADARKRLTEATSAAAIETINKEIETYEGELSKYENLGKSVAKSVEKGVQDSGPIWKDDAANLKDIGGNIEILNKKLQTASVSEAVLINQQIDGWNKKADAIRNAGKVAEQTAANTGKTLKDGWSGVKTIGSSIEDLTESLQGNGNAWQTIVNVVDSFLALYEGFQTVIELIATMTGVTKVLTASKQSEAVATQTATAAAVSGAAQEMAASTALAATKGVETTANVAAAASGALSAHASIPFVGIALGLAAVAAIIATMLTLPKAFAKGGVVSGPTLALVGEYAGANNNPEVIAPLDKLRGMLADTGGFGGGKVSFEIEGRKLRGVLEKEYNVTKRS